MSRPDDDREAPIPDLEELFQGRRAPAQLEDLVIAAVRDSGWPGDVGTTPVGALGGGLRRPGAGRWALRVAANFLVFLAGWGAGRSTTGPEPAPTHLLLLWEDERFTPEATPGAHAQAYGAWLGTVAAAGTWITGQELAPPRIYANPLDGGTDGDPGGDPSPEPPGEVRADARIGGLFLVRAESLQDAARIAATHPHRANGGWIEVAEIVHR